jgi:hypothetical protein
MSKVLPMRTDEQSAPDMTDEEGVTAENGLKVLQSNETSWRENLKVMPPGL